MNIVAKLEVTPDSVSKRSGDDMHTILASSLYESVDARVAALTVLYKNDMYITGVFSGAVSILGYVRLSFVGTVCEERHDICVS